MASPVFAFSLPFLCSGWAILELWRLRLSKYDLVIIGSGPGGYVTAIRAAQWGLKTLVIEKDGFLGGTCLHVGCIPTKVLLHHAEIYDTFKNAREFGIEVSGLQVDWNAVMARKDKIVNKHAKGIEYLFRKHKVETMRGWGRWAGAGRVAVEADGHTTEVESEHIMFATGSEARSLPGVEFDGSVVVGNRDILKVPRIPKTIVIVGAGAVGVEFASIFRSFGSEVTLLEALPRIVPLEDEEISPELEKAFRKRGIQIFTEARVESVQVGAGTQTGVETSVAPGVEASEVGARVPLPCSVTRREPRRRCAPSMCSSRLGGRQKPTTWASKNRASNSSAGSCTPVRTWRPLNPVFTLSVISWRECRSSRMPLRWKASSPSGKLPAGKCPYSNARVSRMPLIASRKSDRLD